MNKVIIKSLHKIIGKLMDLSYKVSDRNNEIDLKEAQDAIYRVITRIENGEK